MGSYMAYRHHLPEDEAVDGVDAAATVQLNQVELAELDDE
jgi:hypothetical protein